MKAPHPSLLTKDLTLGAAYLNSFGFLGVPRNMWLALQRFDAWIEPSIVAEWIKLMRSYAESQGRILDEGAIARAMTWSDPERDVAMPRKIAIDMIKRGRSLHCVWRGRRLTTSDLDIDHCFPWSAWPCGDLWNLVPSLRSVNQHKKRDRLPTDRLLGAAQDRIFEWWDTAYRSPNNEALAPRFNSEARASLPALVGENLTLDDIHAAVRFQRLRLQRDQQIEEWDGR